jgi:hypothetical protein
VGSLEQVVASSTPGVVELDICDTTDPAGIAGVLSWLVELAVGAGVGDGLWYQSSAAAVAGVRLVDGRSVVVHAYRPGTSAEFVEGVVRVQRHLVDVRFPSARPLSGPVSAGGVLGRVESLRPDPGQRRFEAQDMSASAQGLARLVALAAAVDPAGLDTHPMSLPDSELYTEPHSAVFDFAATSAGAEWIDAVARAARAEMVSDSSVIAHGDWSARNVRLDRRGLCGVYDWESLQLVAEATAVGIAAATWCSLGGPSEPLAPSASEIRAYVGAYESHQGGRFELSQRRGAWAAAVFALAYTARCEHALEPGTRTGRASGRLAAGDLWSLVGGGA